MVTYGEFDGNRLDDPRACEQVDDMERLDENQFFFFLLFLPKLCSTHALATCPLYVAGSQDSTDTLNSYFHYCWHQKAPLLVLICPLPSQIIFVVLSKCDIISNGLPDILSLRFTLRFAKF